MKPELYAGLRDLERSCFLMDHKGVLRNKHIASERVKMASERVMGVENLARRLRKRDYAWAKKLYIYECIRQELTPKHSKYSHLARKINVNHATVLHHYKTAIDLLAHDKEFRRIYSEFKTILNEINNNQEPREEDNRL